MKPEVEKTARLLRLLSGEENPTNDRYHRQERIRGVRQRNCNGFGDPCFPRTSRSFYLSFGCSGRNRWHRLDGASTRSLATPTTLTRKASHFWRLNTARARRKDVYPTPSSWSSFRHR